MTKRYDRDYFEKWYRSRAHRVHELGEVRRKVALAVAVAEYFVRRKIESVLDVGCGEGAWYTHLHALRRGVKYAGIDTSEYVIERFGAERNIVKGSFGNLRERSGAFDLVVCSDVLHYLSERELRRGLPQLVRMTEGIAFIEVLTNEDEIIGDVEGLIRRPAAWYRKLFNNAGLAQVAPYCWLPRAMQNFAAELEIVK